MDTEKHRLRKMLFCFKKNKRMGGWEFIRVYQCKSVANLRVWFGFFVKEFK